ncbi:MAG: hypothetical protein CMH91_14455 [Oceanicaulis sp.]|uniref:hypothetical protein n=1 Tax=unclassified Oceanicaulis TaxID=2632123 RepID=UPI0000669815|nr:MULTISPECIES: hypothetical protein [unclassified Oceanicaulis]EAP89376.1 hypothetical protein OA2633_08929 [Oceanicaulis sp. HTCC2633]MBC40247.1 hypothetical protein [Oceanicaulis sp.]MBG34327.1 hypothetical protein [Oceanicaulis sp.]HBU63615.1 hypothetical protein [Oceanicaulis sp.]HCR93913.1 hypothetical protein [Oceanicaulis sp.]|tara:strand:+ start:280 stop:612 length:333 start_codon:yes stop_codon:yes gene_type:complete
MNRKCLCIGTATLLALGACAAPNNDRVDLEASRLASAQAGEEMVCARERTTGTRLGELICRTQAEIEQRRELSQEYARQRHSQRRSGTITNPRTFGPSSESPTTVRPYDH